MHMSEKPLTHKVNLGEEPLSNTIWGVNATYNTESGFLTTLIDKLPFVHTKAKSHLTIDTEFARFQPGTARGAGGNAYLDDFEGSKISLDMKGITQWKPASTPQDNLFPEGKSDSLDYGYNRAKLAWYIVDPIFYRMSTATLRGREVVEIRIPAGVGEGMVLTVTGKGNAARHGGVNGDLQVMIEEESNPELVRDGNDLIHNLNITVTTALLGGTVEVPTVDGRAKIKIAPGTHAGKVLRLGGKGLPDVNGYGRGDELVVVDITIPSKLSAEEKRLVEQLAQQPGFQHAESVKNQNIFERMKSFFR